MPSDSPTTPSELPRLIAELLERMETEGPAAIEAACAAQPELAGAIRQRIALLQGMGLLDLQSPAPGTFPERLGSFRLVQCLGGGGMGVVYLAIQEPIGREVALKVIRPENLYFPGARERFQREAEAVARLQHPGIVPLFTVGEEKGVPYFAMEYVRGASLDQIRRRLIGRDPATLTGEDMMRAIDPSLPSRTDAGGPGQQSSGFGRTWVGACLRIALLVSEALAHAHARGVLHRDVKPSNIMLTSEGRVLLLDFGLAELAGATHLTRTGSQVGSLAYMSPEQLRSDLGAVDERSDVYSLGITLHELLALRPPFHEQNMGALQQQILAGVPESLRQHNRAVPRDVETVCKTAMECERSRRYATAAAFGDDLRRLIELRPIAAQRTGVALRTRRFAQRHPAMAVALVLGILLVVGGPIAFGLVEHFATVRIQKALDGERREKALAHRNLERSFRALDQLALRLSEERLNQIPHMTEVRRDLLADALKIYQDILKDQSDEPEARLRTADTARRVGSIQWQLGDVPAAMQALDQSLALLEECLAIDPHSIAARLGQALARRVKADVMASRGQLGEAERLWRLALAAFEDLAATQPDDAYLQWSLGQACTEFPPLLEELGHNAEAEIIRRRAVEILDHEAGRHPDDQEIGLRLTSALANFGAALLLRHRPTEAKPLLSRALTLMEQLRPVAGRHAKGIAMILSNLGLAHLEDDEFPQAEQYLRRALELGRSLVRDFPSEPMHAHSLSQVLIYLATTLKEAGRADEADAVVLEAVQQLRQLCREHPDVPDYRASLANALGEHADACLLAQRTDDARSAYAESQQAIEELVADNPQNERHHANLAYTLTKQAAIAIDAGEFARARAIAERALTELAAARGINPDDPNTDELTCAAAMHLGGALYCLHDHAALIRLVDGLVALKRDTRDIVYRCGWLLTYAAKVTGDDDSLPAADREELQTQRIEAAITCLARAQELGSPVVKAFLLGDDCQVLHRSPRFAPLARKS